MEATSTSMDKVERRLARFRAALKSKRKLSLPMFLHQFHHQWSPDGRSRLPEEDEDEDDLKSLSNGSWKKDSVRKLSSCGNSFSSASIPNSVEKELRRGMSISFSSRGEAEAAGRRGTFSRRRKVSRDVSFSGTESVFTVEQVREAFEARRNSVAQQELKKENYHPLLIATVSSPGGTTGPAVILHKKDDGKNTKETSEIDGTPETDGRTAKLNNELNKNNPKSLVESNLRQVESLENVSQNWSPEKNAFELPAENSVSSAVSLPQIHQLSDYEDSPAPIHHKPSPSPRNAESKRPKKKRTNLRRRPATREKDGRSKSLTQIDNLVGSSNDMLLLGSSGEDGPTTGTDKLGIPDEAPFRRPPLSMENRVMSGEFITAVIECGKDSYEEVILASRGVTLREALENRALDPTTIEVVQENGRAPISLLTDTSELIGKCIHIRGRDDSRHIVRSRSAQHPRKVPSASRFIWGGGSTEDYTGLVDERTNSNHGSQDGSMKAKNNKSNNRWSLFQPNTKDVKMDELIRQLDLYSKNGIPKLPHLLPCQSVDEENEVKLPKHWRDMVAGSDQLSEREEHRNSAVWELVETEATYINMLKVITDLFLACLCNLQNERILNDIDTEKLFNNIQDIYQANLRFWKEHFCVMLEHSTKTRKPLDPTFLADGFYKVEEILRPYTEYCLEQTNCQQYCKFHARENSHFKAYLAWCETQKECNRLKLVDILVHPMQRLTRYSILLKAILKKTDEEEQRTCIRSMIGHVDRFVSTVNSALRNCYEQERLRQIIKKIESYDAVESKDDELSAAVRQHSELNLMQKMPGCPEHIPRWLIHQGDFRLRDTHTSKMEVHVFVFTDFILITKYTQRKTEKVKVVRPPYRIDKLLSVELKDALTLGLIHMNEWNVASTAFTLQSPDPKAHKAMQDAFSTARKQYHEAKLCRNQPPCPSYDADDEVSSHLPTRSPRLSSSPRGSRVSSLGHSHSGSMDLNEGSYMSPGGHHPPSVDLSDIRGSSASSEDSIPQAEIQRSKSLEGQQSSMRPDRRSAFPKTPNTLSVTPPYMTGQSMPNLTSESSNSLRVPSHNKPLSPGSRGISYPPPSPRTLKRCPPVPQSRNPPLLKTRHVTSVVGSPQEMSGLIEAVAEENEDHNKRRLVRGDRLENRRYLTAGAIDDLKKQDSKDSSIHKRLSWNYGQGPPPPPPRDTEDIHYNRLSTKLHKSSIKSISNDSVHSSSGVSSTSSLHRSEYEPLENEEESNILDLSINEFTSLKLSPHISTTYICHDSDITLGASASQYITQPVEDTQAQVEPKPSVKIGAAEDDQAGLASVQITVNDTAGRNPLPSFKPSTTSSSLLRSSSSFSSSSSFMSSSSCGSTTSGAVLNKNVKEDESMKELLLNDANMEASDV